MKVTINTSPVKDAGLALSREIASLLLEWGASVWVDEQIGRASCRERV